MARDNLEEILKRREAREAKEAVVAQNEKTLEYVKPPSGFHYLIFFWYRAGAGAAWQPGNMGMTVPRPINDAAQVPVMQILIGKKLQQEDPTLSQTVEVKLTGMHGLGAS